MSPVLGRRPALDARPAADAPTRIKRPQFSVVAAMLRGLSPKSEHSEWEMLYNNVIRSSLRVGAVMFLRLRSCGTVGRCESLECEEHFPAHDEADRLHQ